jgi:hypothetical protein
METVGLIYTVIIIIYRVLIFVMGSQEKAIPEDIPQHPYEMENVNEDTTIGQLMEGVGVNSSIVMKWAGSVNKYAYELTSPPELPSKFEALGLDQVKETPLSECSSEEVLALIGWYWYESGENKEIFTKGNNKQKERKEIPEIKKYYSITHRFDTELDRVNIQSLGMSIYSKESGGIDWSGFDLVDGAEEKEGAVYYPPNVEDGVVLMFSNGKGYYCCHSEGDIKPIDEWFRTVFNNWSDEGIVPLQLNDFD